MSLRVNITTGKMGDCILAEPAINAAAIADGEPADVYVVPKYRFLFEGHPWIRLVDEPHAEPDVTTDSSIAYHGGHFGRIPFAAGYFTQFGLPVRPSDRVHYERYRMRPVTRVNRIILSPFCLSCGRFSGHEPNVTPPWSFWEPVIKAAPYPVFAIGHPVTPMIEWCTNIKTTDDALHWLYDFINESRLLISVETGLLHLVSAMKIPTVFLSTATPIVFAKPDTRCEVVRSEVGPKGFAPDAVIEAMRKLLSE